MHGRIRYKIQEETNMEKQKKPFYRRWWFIVIGVALLVSVATSFMSKEEKINWSDLILGDMIPEPDTKQGEIHENSSEELRIELKNIDSKTYNQYIKKCQKKGFTIDESKDLISWVAFNKEGYELSLTY